ncbi:chorion peroxidase [Plakobranchus ocellatus]|uniref:Chorion peroxidase n=1 Tax=Plakobranchus ocellatus TaxID=259542 RepID=A0AAV4A589_9GAST|nr:chorion peroxidase [Plakobranchus ocellatus]
MVELRTVSALKAVNLAMFVIIFLLISLTRPTCACQYSGQISASHLAHIQSARMKRDTITCNATYPYRSFDGSCNNLNNPTYGQIGAMFRRILDPVYGGDGSGSIPRLNGSSGVQLPNPRSVSVLIHDPANFIFSMFTQLVMQWGQFLDHDMTLTPTATNATVCCYDSLVTSDEVHPDVTTGGTCFPIIIDEGDRYFDTVTSRCMVFYRSDPVMDSSGTRQQYNAVTPWIDGSQIYGYTDAMAASLRSMSEGKLLVNTVGDEDFLPSADTSDDSVCFVREEGEYCFLAGDARVNVFAGLSAFHTIFVRYHNKLCDRLLVLHPEYDDETLFQEARRIVVAVLQVR